LPPSSSKRLVFVGRLSAEKGVGVLLDAFASVSDAAAELHIVGSGELAGAVDAAARADRRITVHGQVGPDVAAATMASGRAVVVPSVWDEPFGRTAVEALSVGRPVLSTGRGGLAEIVDSSTGWVSGTDAPGLGAAMSDALAASADRIDAMGRAARGRYESRFTPEVKTRNLIAIYNDVVAL
jgi:glycosyltransferase involved in cell wall biosynthesis